MTDRYDGKPFLRLLDSYVLWSIGELSPSDASTLDSLSERLSQIYEIDGSWIEIVERLMDLPPSLPQELREMWARTRESIATASDQAADPGEWARLVVDENLV